MKATALSPGAHADIVGRTVSHAQEQAGSQWHDLY